MNKKIIYHCLEFKVGFVKKLLRKILKLSKRMLDVLSYYYKAISYDHKFYDSYTFQDEMAIHELPEFDKIPCNIGIIADEFFYNSLQGVVDTEYITPDNYKDVINAEQDILMIVSSWRGLNNEWRGMVYDKDTYLSILSDVVKFYRSVKPDGKVVFYSKEDPVNYHHFVEYAQLADVVFTTALEKVEDYKKYCGHDRIHVLKFGFNPFLFNPNYDTSKQIKGSVLFAGSWMRKYPERCDKLAMMFDSLIRHNVDLKIVDRNYHLKHARYMFPLRFTKYCMPSLKHHQLVSLYRSFETVININSITQSETMFAVRAYELLAMGKIVISNGSIGMEKLLPEVIVINDEKDIEKFLSMSDTEKDALRKKGIDNVFNNHTMFHRVNEMLQILQSDGSAV